ncbi:MAG: CoA transferase [Betaproteobacteria bacterium]|nr:CoA transferase [Betaproteobacteria bacterium]
MLDLTNVLAGPFCAYQLALLGADVIKVEEPRRGDLARQLGADAGLNSRLMGASFIAQNAGKKSLALDLKKQAGCEALLRLVESADVLIENFRPGVMDRLGLGYDVLSARNPQLVYCAISGFGQDGPMKSAPAYDQIVQGLSGVMSITGDADSAPLRVGYPICDSIGGLTAAFAVTSALVGRAQHGRGQFIDVSMLDATLVTMGWVVSNFLIAGREPHPLGNENFTAAPSGTFATGDGLLNIAANRQEQFVALTELIGRPELAHDPRFAEREARKRYRTELKEQIEQALAARSAHEWEGLLAAHGVPAGRVLSVPEALAHPQVRQRELLAHFDSAAGVDRPFDVVRSGFKMSEGNPDVALPPPRLGEHSEEILGSIGYSVDEIAAMRAQAVI